METQLYITCNVWYNKLVMVTVVCYFYIVFSVNVDVLVTLVWYMSDVGLCAIYPYIGVAS